MKRIILTTLSLLFAGFVFLSAASAQEEGHINLKTVAEVEKVIVNENGEKETIRVPAAKVIPGDEVIYTISYWNIGDEPAEKVVITDPIPEHMLYTGGNVSGEGMEITFSVDDGNTYDKPENLKVIGEDGKERKAILSEYTHIRWTMKRDLQPGEEGKVEFRAELE